MECLDLILGEQVQKPAADHNFLTESLGIKPLDIRVPQRVQSVLRIVTNTGGAWIRSITFTG